MQKRLLLWLVGVSFSLPSAPAVAEKPADWLGREVMLVAADVTFRDGPSPDASVVDNPTGGSLRLEVQAFDGDWLQVKGKWVRRSDITPREAAVEFFSDQIQRKPTPFALISRAEARMAQSQFDEALIDAEEALKLDPKFALGYAVRGHINAIRQNLDGALRDFDEALTLEPKLHTARIGREFVIGGLRAQYAILAGRHAADAAAEEPDKLDLDDPRMRAVRLFNSACQRGFKGDHREASADLEEAVRLAPELRSATFFSDRSHQYFMLHEYDKAKADLREAISLEPENAFYHESLGRICMMQQDWDGAIEKFALAFKLSQGAGENGPLERAESSLLLPNTALQALAPPELVQSGMALYMRQNLVDALIQRGIQRLTKGDVAGASADFDRAVEVDSKSTSARTSRALFLADLGDFDRALQDCDAAIGNDRKSPFPLCVRGKVLLAKSDFAKALEAFNLAVERFPLEAAPLLARAEAWTSKGQLGRALDDLNYATVLEPGNAFCYGQRATVLRLLKRDEEAKADFEKAQELINALTKPQ